MPNANVAKVFEAIALNLTLTAQSSDQTAKLLDTVKSTLSTLRGMIQPVTGQTLTQSEVDSIVDKLDQSNGQLSSCIENLGKISETAALTSPIVESPTEPVPALEETPMGVDQSVASEILSDLPEGEIPFEVVVSAPEIGLDGAMEVNAVEPE